MSGKCSGNCVITFNVIVNCCNITLIASEFELVVCFIALDTVCKCDICSYINVTPIMCIAAFIT